MLRLLALGLLLALPEGLAAQEGTIVFTHSVRVEIPAELRARMEARGGMGNFPTERTSEVVLLFSGSESVMKPVPGGEGGRQPGAAMPRGDVPTEAMARMRGMATRLRMRSAARSDRETLREAYVDYGSGTIVESREFLGRNFVIADERPEYQWRLTGEQAEFLGHVVHKATAVQDSTEIEAWFTPEIPVPGGPGTYGGLPGMILVISVDQGHTQYTATGVSMNAIAEGVIVPPDDGDEMTREEYEAMVAEKLEELRTVGGGDGR